MVAVVMGTVVMVAVSMVLQLLVGWQVTKVLVQIAKLVKESKDQLNSFVFLFSFIEVGI